MSQKIAGYTLLTVILFGFGSLTYYYNSQVKALKKLNAQTTSQLQQSKLEIGRAQTEIVKQKQIHKLAIKSLEEKQVKEIRERDAKIVQYATIISSYEKQVRGNLQTITTLKNQINTLTGQVSFITNAPNDIFYVKEGDKFIQVEKIEYSYRDFRITIFGDALAKTINYNLHQKFRTELVETKLPNGVKNHYVNVYEIDDKGKDVGKLKIDHFKVLRAHDLASSFKLWNPKLDLGIQGGMSLLEPHMSAGLGISLSSWGKTKNDISMRFLRLGIQGGTGGLNLSVSPVLYNLGEVLPLVSNLWIGPFVGWEFGNAKVILGLGISVVF